jgi:hypothetical protein
MKITQEPGKQEQQKQENQQKIRKTAQKKGNGQKT